MVRTLRFLKEYIKWVIYGKKYRTQEHIEILYQICSECPMFERYAPNDDDGTCTICGCNINKDRKLMNKLAWNTTKCPDKPPKW